MNTQGEDCHLKGKERGLRRNQHCQQPDLELPSSRSEKNKLVDLNYHLHYFVMAVLEN